MNYVMNNFYFQWWHLNAIFNIHQGMNKTCLQLFMNCLKKLLVHFKILNKHENFILPVIFFPSKS